VKELAKFYLILEASEVPLDPNSFVKPQ